MPTPVLLMVRALGIGGCERDLTKIAVGLDRTRFEPHVGCFVSEGLRAGELRSHGIPIVQFEVPSFLSTAVLKGARQMGRYLKEHRIQLIHTFDVPMDIFGLPVARFYRTPVVISSNLWYRDLVPNRERALLRITDRFADIIIVNSRAVQAELTGREGIAAERTFLNYNGVDTCVFYPAPGIERRVFPNAPVIVGAVCALRAEKRMDILMDAFARVKDIRPGARLVIVGSGPALAELERQSATLGIAELCHFEPSQQDVADWMRTLDIFVMASDSESFPNALLEAMACGCCVIGSEVGGIPELIDDGRTGLLFRTGSAADLTNKLATVLRDDELRKRLGAAAANSAREKFPMESTLARIEALYEDLLNKTISR